jgi:hypothetical protein
MLVILAALSGVAALLLRVPTAPRTAGAASRTAGDATKTSEVVTETSAPDRVPVKLYEFSSPVSAIEFEVWGQEPFSIVSADGSGFPRDREPGSAVSGVAPSGALPGDVAPSFTAPSFTAPGFTVSGYEGVPLDLSKIASLFDRARSLTAAELLFEDYDDPAELGFAPPVARINVTAIDGEEVVFLIGKEIPGSAEVYAQIEGQSAVYLVYRFAIENYLLAKTGFVSLTVTSSKTAASDFDRITLTGPTCGQPEGKITVEVVGEERIRHITYPVFCRVDYPVLLSLQYIFLLDAKSVAAVYPSPEELGDLGFDEPFAIVEAVISEEAFVLRFARPDADGDVYLIRDGIPILYIVPVSEVLWLGKNYFGMMEKIAFAPDINMVEEVAVWTLGSVRVYRIISEEGKFAAVSAGGQYLDPDDFQEYFRILCSAKYEEAPDEPGGFPPIQSQAPLPDLRFTYKLRNGEEHVVSFYKGPVRRHYIYVDSEPGYLINSLYVETIIGQL